MPSPRPAKINEQQWKVSEEVRPATNQWEDAGLLLCAKSVNSASENDRRGRPIPKLWEWYYPEPRRLGRRIGGNFGPGEEQHNRSVPLRRFPSIEAKAPPSPKSRIREGQVQPRTESHIQIPAKDYHSYAAHFALTLEAQEELDRPMRADLERIEENKAEIEAAREAKEVEQQEKAKATQELMAAIAANLKEHRRPQQGGRVEYLLLRVGQKCAPPWPTDEEMRDPENRPEREWHCVWDTLCYSCYAQKNGPYADAIRRRPM